MTFDQIGEFQFVSMSRMPEIVRQSLAVVARPGVDGVAVWKTGERGKPFTIRTLVDCFNVLDGLDTWRSYRDLIGEPPQTAVWADLNFDVSNLRFFVLDVRLAANRRILASDGGLLENAGAILECDWDLLPVAWDA
jgi:hypothetical protein